MIRKVLESYKHRILIFYFALMLILLYFLKSLIFPFAVAALLAYMTHPLYLRTKKLVKNKYLSSALVVVQTDLVIILPIVYLTFQLIYTFIDIYREFFLSASSTAIKNKLIELLYLLIPSEVIRDQVIQAFTNITQSVFQYLYLALINLTLSLPSFIVYLVLISLSQYYLLIYGKRIILVVYEHLPFGEYNNLIFKNLAKTVDSLIFGIILPALAQSLALVFILFVLGINVDYILVGFLGFLMALVPSLGIWVVWLPLSIKVWMDSTTKLVIYFVYNLIVTSNVDFITRILITSKTANVPMWLVVFTTFGGLLSFGFLGMLISLFLGTFLYNLYHDIKLLEEKK